MSQTRGKDSGRRRARGQPSEATKNKRLASLKETVNNRQAKGIAMGHYLLNERRHRHNHVVSEKRRTGFPKLGTFDTWLVDIVQTLVEKNHNILLWPGWSNTADFAETPEDFGVTAIHSEELAAAFTTMNISDEARKSFTADQRFLCRRMRTPAPLLPVHTQAEQKLFATLVRTTHTDGDMDRMAIDWCKSVNGISIFPKLPVHLRTYRSDFIRNSAIKEAQQDVAHGERVLAAINARTLQLALGQQSLAHAAAPSTPSAPASLVQVGAHPLMNSPCDNLLALPTSVTTTVVAGNPLPMASSSPTVEEGQAGEAPVVRRRGPDKPKKDGGTRSRTCKRCSTRAEGAVCPGRFARSTRLCKYYNNAATPDNS